MKYFYKIEDKEDFNEIAKNILICVKKNIYYSDIKCLLYFIALFKSNETELTKYLKEKQYKFEDKEHFNFDKLVNISNYLEEKKININNGKDDSPLIKFVRLLYNKEKGINFLKKKDMNSTIDFLKNLDPNINPLKNDNILEYISCINFINDMKENAADSS